MSVSIAPAPIPEVRKADCAQCGGIRNCDVRGEHLVRYDDGHYQSKTSWYILECRGCENVFVQTNGTNSEDYESFYNDDGSVGTEYAETLRYWPALSTRKKPEWMSEGGIDAKDVDALDAAMIELYGALDGDLRMLAAIGVRTSCDIASELLGIDPHLSFDKKLDSLVIKSLIGIADKDSLAMVVDAGGASAHRGWRPSPSELGTMMGVLEHFVEKSFVAPARKAKLDEEATKVRKTVPPRPPRVKKRLDKPNDPDI